MSIAEIENMTQAERLSTMEALWDILCHEKPEPDSPDWHEDILAERSRKIESGEARFISLEEAKRKIEE